MCLCGDKSRAKGLIEGIKLLSSMRLCSNVPAQSLIPAALASREQTKELLVPGGRVYEQRECIYNALKDMEGVSVVKPKAAFYIFPGLDRKKYNIYDDEKLVLDILKEKHILLTRGGGFHWETPGYFRIVYLPECEVLERAAANLKEFLAGYRQ